MTNVVNNIRSRVKSPSRFEMNLLGETKEGGAQPTSSSSQEPVQVEPKTYFANERTFIQWISAALLLLTVSSIMMGSGSYNGTSSVIAFCSLVLVVYAAFVYFRRVQLLRSGNAYGYLDFIGPSILAAGVGLGVFIVFADAVKGSEFLPFGSESPEQEEDSSYYNRRLLKEPSFVSLGAETEEVRPIENVFHLQEVEGKCSRYSIDGINLLEYEPRDILLNYNKNKKDSTDVSTRSEYELIVATPQALISHPLSGATPSAFLSEFPDTELQSMTMVGDRLFALSTGPTMTELIEFRDTEIQKFLIQDSKSTSGSIVFVPSSGKDNDNDDEGKLYIHLDGSLHTYHIPPEQDQESPLSRLGSINMKVLNRGLVENDDPITAMEHFEGLTYVLRERRNTIEAWDLNSATLVAEMPLPDVSKNDKWVGMAFERRRNDENLSHPHLRNSKMATATTEKETNTSVYLHMPLDTFPPQLWSFRLENTVDGNEHELNDFSFPECDGGVAMN